jgi:transposase
LSDAPVAGRPTRIVLWVRRFFCDNATCPVKTFAEQVDGLTRRWSRVSEGLRQMLTAAGLALAGRAGARLAAALGIPVSRHRLLRLLRLVRALPDPPVGEVAVLGIDDFAVRRGHHYGTVLIDCETHRVVDLLPGRDAAPLTAWLQQHPAPGVICRDRASAYAEAARTGAPDAVQVADRFHLWQNLAAAVERCVAQYKACINEPCEGPDGPPEPAPTAEPIGAMAERRRAHHALVHELLARGAGFRQIARHLGWNHRTVSRYAHAATWQEMLVGQKVRPSLVDPFKPYLIQRINQGCLKAATLHREIRAQGFAGSYAILRKVRRAIPQQARPDIGAAPALSTAGDRVDLPTS